MKHPIFFSLNIVFLLLILQISTSCQETDYKQQINPLIDKYLDSWNTGNLEALDAITSAEFELRINPDFKTKTGRDLLKEEIANTRKAFPDFHLTVEKRLFVGDSAVVIQWTLTGTNTGKAACLPQVIKLIFRDLV